MLNPLIAQLLTDFADLLEIKGDNPFRIRAYRRAAQTVEGLTLDLGALLREEQLKIPGIGKGIADLIGEVKNTGRCLEVDQLKKQFPAGLLEMMKLQGLGPKRALALYQQLNIDSLEKLAKAAQAGLLARQKGWGEKIQATLLQNLAYTKESGRRRLLPDALRLAESIHAYLEKSDVIDRVEIAGSLRRWKETIGDLDFVCTSRQPTKAIDHFLNYSNEKTVLGAGGTKASIRLVNGVQVDFRVVDKKSFGAALLYFTGSKEHNVRLRERAQQQGLTLNEYGLYNLTDKHRKKPVAGETEQQVYRALGLQWIPPELREDRGEIQAAARKKLPKLIEMEDIRGDFHNHTTLSDGRNSLEEMVEAAKKRGWSYFYSGDHSPSLKVASGLPVPILMQKIKDAKALDAQQKGFRVRISSEVDILKDGEIDYPDEIVAQLDCVVASIHTRFNQSEEEMTHRLCRAASHPQVHILGHLSGRKIGTREPYRLHYEHVFETARKHRTALEINGQPERQELTDVHVKRAIELGIPLALSTDAHSTQELDNIRTALHIARRGWAEAKNIINTYSFNQLDAWLRS